jgi:hypothetical protein
MRIRLAVPDAATNPGVLDAALEAVTQTNEKLIADGVVPTAAEAIANGVKWKPEPPGDEHFDNAARVNARGWGDCDDLAPYHAASLRITGEDPEARATVIKTGPKRWHAIVERSDGSFDDPSAEAGMYEYHAPIQPKLRGPDGHINIATKQVNGVWCARCDVPWAHERHAVSGHGLGADRGDAIIGALEGPTLLGAYTGVIEPEHVAKMAVLHGVLCGDDLDGVYRAVQRRLTRAQFTRAAKQAMRMGPSQAAVQRIRASRASGDDE